MVANIGEGCGVRFEGESSNPSQGGSLVPIGVAIPDEQAHPEGVIEADHREFGGGSSTKLKVALLKCSAEASVGRALARR